MALTVLHAGMATVMFALEPVVREKVAALVAGSVNVIELNMTPKETIGLTEARLLSLPAESIGATISTSSPSFVFISHPKTAEEATASSGGLFKSTQASMFVYCCPITSSPRQKMTFSTAKAAVIASASELGLNFDKVFEVMNDEGTSPPGLHFFPNIYIALHICAHR